MFFILFIFLLLCGIQLFFIILWRQPQIILEKKLLTKSAIKPTKILLIVSMISLYFALFVNLGMYHKPHLLEEKEYVTTGTYPTIQPGIIEQLAERKTLSITHFYFLYRDKNISKEKLSSIAFRLRQEHCRSLCIIHIYDDKTAYEKDIERVDITSNEVMKNWNRKNYVFVAEHYLGYLDAVQNASFAYYPFKDGYYKKVKAGSLDGY